MKRSGLIKKLIKAGCYVKRHGNRHDIYLNAHNGRQRLFGNLTVADLLADNYTSQTRNKLIAKAFKEIGLIERYGSGIRRILNICRDYGLKQPVLEEVSNGFKVTLFKEKTDNADRVTDKVTDRVTDDLTENQKHIVKLIQQNNQITSKELAEKIKISQRKIKENLRKLKEKGIITRIGPPRGGYWGEVGDSH